MGKNDSSFAFLRLEFDPAGVAAEDSAGAGAATLDDVFIRFRHQLDGELPASELSDLLAYLNSL